MGRRQLAAAGMLMITYGSLASSTIGTGTLPESWKESCLASHESWPFEETSFGRRMDADYYGLLVYT